MERVTGSTTPPRSWRRSMKTSRWPGC